MSEALPAPLSGPRLAPMGGGPARALLVLLHGYGASGSDLIDWAPPLQIALPDAEILVPDAPFPCEMGFGRQWFSLADRSLEAMHAGAVSAAPILENYLEVELAGRGLEGRHLILAGFSQGCMMALHTGLRRATAPAAILAYSGVLVGAEMLEREVRCRPPVLVVHGGMDEVVPVAAVDHTEAALKRAGVPVTTLVRPALGHGIDPEGIAAGLAFLRQHRPA